MGRPEYNVHLRSVRASSSGYYSKSADEIFTQSRERRMHDSMDPKKALIRESRDSENHPNSVPIILGLDVTGSMGHIPHFLVKDGLPKIMGGIIQKGIPDPQILFTAIGDTECDSYPLQVGQFESGDEELDMWLTRVYLESGGGGNAGESYLLAWMFAANHTVTDAWEKRKQKGFLFTVGDEPCLPRLSATEMKEVMGVGQGASAEEFLKAAQEKWNVYHLHIMEGSAGRRSLSYWKELLGENCIQIDNHEKVADAITRIVTENTPKTTVTPTQDFGEGPESEDEMFAI